MPAAYQDLYIEQGTTFSTTITLDDVYGQAYNLYSYTASSMMRASYYSSSPTATFQVALNPVEGVIVLGLDSPTTANISPARYVYDTVIIDQNGNVTRVLEGIATVSPSVTR
jgi:hypothetical protein